MDLHAQVQSLNAYIQGCPWFDFDIIKCDPYRLIIHGGLDLSVDAEVAIQFDNIFAVSTLMTWKTDTSRQCLSVLSGEEARRLNLQYHLEQGHHLYAFQPEYYPDTFRCWIAAKTMSWQPLADRKGDNL